MFKPILNSGVGSGVGCPPELFGGLGLGVDTRPDLRPDTRPSTRDFSVIFVCA